MDLYHSCRTVPRESRQEQDRLDPRDGRPQSGGPSAALVDCCCQLGNFPASPASFSRRGCARRAPRHGAGVRGGHVRVMSRSPAEGEWFERCVLEALPDLFGAALRLTRNRADADDLVAETVARGWTHLDTLTDRDRFRGWLFRILTNAFLSTRRVDVRRGVHESLDDQDAHGYSLFEQLHAPILLWWGNPEQEFLDKLLRED